MSVGLNCFYCARLWNLTCLPFCISEVVSAISLTVLATLSLFSSLRVDSSGRLVPLSQRAMSALIFWATHFRDRKPEHYVFSSKRYSGAGDGFLDSPKAFHIVPTKPIGSIKEAWETAGLEQPRSAFVNIRQRTRMQNKSKRQRTPLPCRFHDLRHTAVSRMLNAGVSIAKVAKIVGWSASTMVLKAKRNGHFALNDLGDEVESTNKSGIDAESLVFSPVSNGNAEAKRPT